MLRRVCILVMIISSCKSPTSKDEKDTTVLSDSTSNKSIRSTVTRTRADSGETLKTHLHDTTILSGSFILFLRPDSARFESYDEDSGIYDADADFGVAITNSMDGISKNKKYHNLKALISTNRFIIIKDCKTCPLTIDRDTIDYGVILSAKNKPVRTTYGQVHSGDYLQDVNEYFSITD